MGGNHNGVMTDDLALAASIGGATRLDDWGLIRASGPDARSFLHSQLTQDITHLQAGQACLAGYCSAKGRLLATFIVWPAGAEDFLLACSADLLPTTLKRLSMFVLRAKCKLVDASAELALWGLAGPPASGCVGEAASAKPWTAVDVADGQAISLPAASVDGASVPRALLVLRATTPPPSVPVLAAELRRGLEVRSGVGRVVAATVEQFVPQMLNLELVGGVSFSKGCYPGQEVVARSQYRGTLKRRAFVVEGGPAMAPGLEVFHSADPEQPAGMVALSGSLGAHRQQALVELKIAATGDGELHAGSPQGPLLTLRDLPYAFPAHA